MYKNGLYFINLFFFIIIIRYENITNIDLSDVAINKMEEHAKE